MAVPPARSPILFAGIHAGSGRSASSQLGVKQILSAKLR
jgi:hypothetical protein